MCRILRTGADSDEYQDNDVGYEIRQGVDSIRYHRGAVSQYAGNELGYYQKDVPRTSDKCNIVNLPFPIHSLHLSVPQR